MSSTSDKISGKAKQTLGKMTNNKKLRARGKVEETKGDVKSALNDVSKKMSN